MSTASVQSPKSFFDSFSAANPESMRALVDSGYDFDKLREYSVLREGEWEMIDDRVVTEGRKRLTAVQDLIDRGLTHDLGDLGTLVSTWELASDFGPATVSMEPEEGDEDQVDFKNASAPVPIVSKGFRLNLRQSLAGQRRGESLETMDAERAGRAVAEGLEDMLLNGTSIQKVGSTNYGYLTHPNRNILDAGTVAGVTTGEFSNVGDIYPVVSEAVNVLEQDRHYGPFVLYVSQQQWAEGRAIHTDGTGDSAFRRALENIPRLEDIKVLDSLSDGTALMVSLTRDVIDWAIAQDLQTVQWNNNPFVTRFRVMVAAIPRIKIDYSSRSGVLEIQNV